MSKKLYVGNLPFSTTSEKLKELFSKFGVVEAAEVITNKFSGRSKGFGFVTMADEGAEKAKTELNGKEHEGRTLTVNEATPFDPSKPRERKPFNRGYGGGGGGGFRSEGGERRFGGPRRFGGNRDNRDNNQGSEEF